MAKKVSADVMLGQLLVDADVVGASEQTKAALGGAMTMASTRDATYAQVSIANQKEKASLERAQQAHQNKLDVLKAERVNALVAFHVEQSKGHQAGCTCQSCDFLRRHS